MNATRLTSDPLAQDLGPSRPVLSADARKGGGLLSGLLQAIMPSKSGKAQRTEPTLDAARSEEGRREPYLFEQRRATPGTAD